MTPREAFLRACALDVAVRKPGNVSVASPGHGMDAAMFVASAAAAAGPLFETGKRVGARIEAAVWASWAAAGCNTDLGIVLLCAPIAGALELLPARPTVAALRGAVAAVLGDLDVDDARAAYRAIARANPGGLGSVARQDVQREPTVDLRAAMALAADRDRIARQYRDGYADVFETGLPALPPGFALASADPDAPDAAAVDAVQCLWLRLLRAFPDSHIVRKHGEGLAQNVMAAAQALHARTSAGAPLDADPAWAAWDADLKARAVNPGTTADLTVATLFVAGIAAAPATQWHGT